MDDDTAFASGPARTVCLRRPNPLGIIALSGAAWLGLGAALALAGLPPLWAAGLGYVLAPLAVLALLASQQATGTDRSADASAAAVEAWNADRACDDAVAAPARARSREVAQRRIA